MTWGPCTAPLGLWGQTLTPAQFPSLLQGGAGRAASPPPMDSTGLLPKCVLHVQTLIYLSLQEPGPLGLP